MSAVSTDRGMRSARPAPRPVASEPDDGALGLWETDAARVLDALLAEKDARSAGFAVCYLDVDQFQVVNDSSCYAAKDAGRNRVKMFGADDSTLNLRHGRMHWVARLNSALEEDLKLDGMFVQDIDSDPVHLAMVRSINEVGHIMGKKTIAEFVEKDSVRGELAAIGVDLVQGFWIDPPVPIEEVL